MATITQTLPSTAVELPAIRHTTTGERQRHVHAAPESDDVMQASILADSQVPDGGYGWLLISACAVVTWWFVGASYTWGVSQAALVEQMGYSSSTLAFVGSLCPACISLLAVPNARVIRVMGVRRTALLGIFLLGLGSILSGFATESIAGLFITWGVVGGVGTSLCFMVVSKEGWFEITRLWASRLSRPFPPSTLRPSAESPMESSMLVAALEVLLLASSSMPC